MLVLNTSRDLEHLVYCGSSSYSHAASNENLQLWYHYQTIMKAATNDPNKKKLEFNLTIGLIS